MDLGLIIAIVGSAMAIVGVMVAMFLWNRGEARSDNWHMDAKIDVIRDLVHSIHKETQSQIQAMREEGQLQIQGIRDEMRDFHSRLCEIEKGRKGIEKSILEDLLTKANKE